MTPIRCFLLVLVLVLAAGLPACRQATPGAQVQQDPSAAPAAPAPSAVPAQDGPLVVFLGDSLTAGYGLTPEQAFPALVGEALAREGRPIRVVNAGVSGDTSAGGLRRVSWVLTQKPAVVVVGLGANDGLRGQAGQLEGNLTRIVEEVRAAGSRVLLVGMKMPPNLGPAYTKAFAAAYTEVARRLDVPLVPFLLEGVAGRPELNQEDGIHPNAAGQKRLAANVLPRLREVLQEVN